MDLKKLNLCDLQKRVPSDVLNGMSLVDIRESYGLSNATVVGFATFRSNIICRNELIFEIIGGESSFYRTTLYGAILKFLSVVRLEKSK
jgi:hypothetical protein